MLNLTSQKIIIISTGERQAVKELSRNKSIILKKSDKGKHHRIDEQTGQTNEGQVLLDDLNNYRPLDKQMVETTTKKAQPLFLKNTALRRSR